MTNILKFEVEDVNLIYEASERHFAIAEIWVCHDGNNLHGKPIRLENIKRAAPTLLNKFLVADYEKGDFTTHTPYEQIIGFFPKENNIRYEEKDGKTFLVANAIISRIYADWAVAVFEKDNRRPVSMEIEVYATKYDEQGREEITDFVFMGVTVLSKKTQEAMVGSNAVVTKFSVEDAEKFYSEYSQEFSTRYADVDFYIPNGVKKNAKEGLALHQKLNNGSAPALAIARFISKNKEISPERVRMVNKYFMKHADDDLDDKESGLWTNWLLHGGFTARKWARKIVDNLDEIDEQRMSYFTGENTGSDESENLGKEETTIYMDEDEMKDKHEEEHKEEMPEKEECASDETEQEGMKEECAESEKEEEQEEETPEGEKEEGEQEECAAEETPETEKEPAEKEETKEEDMSALMSLFAGEEFEAVRGEVEKKEYAKAFASLVGMFQAMKEKYSDYEELKKFKTDADEQQFKFSVEKVLNEVSKYMPEEEVNQAREDAQNYSLETFSGWANGVRAKAFEFAAKKDEKKDKKEDGERDIVRIGIVNTNDTNNKKGGSVWNRLP